jgi:hypothetical protein
MHDAWDEIERLGRELGAGDEAMRKWRVRGVPPKWQIKIMAADPAGNIDRAAFDNPPGPRRAADAQRAVAA